jgi:hypothetical protein
MAEPLQTTEGLKPGDVVTYSLRIKPKSGEEPYWMTRFAAVVAVRGLRRLEVLTLVLHPDPKWEPRVLTLRSDDTTVTFLPEDRWPQGVVAMRMKHIHTGRIRLED